MTVFVRFAPSPTGYLHAGNVRTALVNWLYARKTGGRFLLRLDDTDAERSRPEYAAAIEEDLSWLGLKWDAFARQSERMKRYEAAKAALLRSGRLYPCYETAEELEMRRKLQAGRGLPPIYDRAALKLSDAEKAKYDAEGRKPHYRFLLEDAPIVWDDLIRGAVKFHGNHVSDPVLVRADGVPLYTLASVVDDGDMGITHIIRGEDHVSNTAVQVQIFEALGFSVPRFGHLALLKTREGELSKRVGGNDIRSLREAGFEPMAVNSLLAKMGTSDAIEPFVDMDALTASFDIAKFGRATATYDAQDLERLNEKLLHQLTFSSVRARLEKLGLSHIDEGFWSFIQSNMKLKKLSEIQEWWSILYSGVTHPVNAGDEDFLMKAAEFLPSEPWNDNTWNQWITVIKNVTGRTGKSLFRPLRLAMTGREDGPELKALMLLMGYEKLKYRLLLRSSV